METETRLTVRYAETDQMGIVHHSNYAVWFEAARTDFLKQIGFSYGGIEEKGVLLPLYELNTKFKKPALYEDEVIIKTRLEKITKVRIIFSYTAIREKDSTVLATGETMHAWTDRNMRPVNAESLVPEVFSYLKKLTV